MTRKGRFVILEEPTATKDLAFFGAMLFMQSSFLHTPAH